jgi:hypothetical protein
MPVDKQALRIWQGQIKEILNRVWDPIGGCPADEYDSYVGRIATMIREDADDYKLMRYLEWAESVNMGLGPFDSERARNVIAALRALNPP